MCKTSTLGCNLNPFKCVIDTYGGETLHSSKFKLTIKTKVTRSCQFVFVCDVEWSCVVIFTLFIYYLFLLYFV